MIRPDYAVVRLFFLMVLLLSGSTVLSSELRRDCHICGMWIDQNLQTRLVFTTFDGDEVTFCSLPCASKYLKEHKANIKHMQVADYLTTELVDADAAFYLVGSDAPPVMSYLSFISFKDMVVAEKFQKLHGGNLMSFGEVLQLLQGH